MSSKIMTNGGFTSDPFESFAIEQILDNSSTDFDVFLNVEGHVILYGASGYRWVKDELSSLLRHGYRHFFVRAKDRAKVGMYRELTKLPKVDHSLPPQERIKSIEQVGAAFTKCLYDGEITEACVDKASQLANSIVNCVGEDSHCVAALSTLADYDYYTYFHSIRVSIYSVAIAIKLGVTENDRLQEIALGGIFHDIGKKGVDVMIVNKVGALTDAEWNAMRRHPVFGFEEVQTSILSHVPREIILHHHEKRDGSGYPHGLDKNSILPEVQIVTLADVFDALTSSRSYQNKRNKYEALDFIKHKMLDAKIPREPFRALVMCLAS